MKDIYKKLIDEAEAVRDTIGNMTKEERNDIAILCFATDSTGVDGIIAGNSSNIKALLYNVCINNTDFQQSLLDVVSLIVDEHYEAIVARENDSTIN
jgi:uncharacterized membrane protein YhfC